MRYEAQGKLGQDQGAEQLAGRERPKGSLIWLNAVGLGEVMALRGLIMALNDRNPKLQFLVRPKMHPDPKRGNNLKPYTKYILACDDDGATDGQTAYHAPRQRATMCQQLDRLQREVRASYCSRCDTNRGKR